MSMQEDLKRRSQQGQERLQKEKKEREQTDAQMREIRESDYLGGIEAQIKNSADNGNRQWSMQCPLHEVSPPRMLGISLFRMDGQEWLIKNRYKTVRANQSCFTGLSKRVCVLLEELGFQVYLYAGVSNPQIIVKW